jgi:hypothetical protein
MSARLNTFYLNPYSTYKRTVEVTTVYKCVVRTKRSKLVINQSFSKASNTSCNLGIFILMPEVFVITFSSEFQLLSKKHHKLSEQ